MWRGLETAVQFSRYVRLQSDFDFYNGNSYRFCERPQYNSVKSFINYIYYT